MTKQLLFAFFLVSALETECFGQSKSEQIKQLRKIANENEERARKAEELTEKYNRLAQDAQKEVERQHYLTLAASISLKSLEIDDKYLSGLLALQAYNFNTKYQGNAFNKDIYNGLYSALKGFGYANTNLTGHNNPVQALITKSETPIIMSLSSDGAVIGWANENNEWKGKGFTPPKIGYDVYAADVSPEGRLWVIGAKKQSGKQIDIYDLTYTSRKIEGLNSEITKIDFVREGKGFYALCNSGNSIFYCDLNKADEVISSAEKITLMDLSPDGSKLAGTTSDGNLYIWDVKKDYANSVYKIANDENQITSIAFTPTGRDLVFGNQKGEVKFFSVEAGVVRKTVSGHFSQIEQIVFSNSGRMMAVVDKAGAIRIWNLSNVNLWPLVIKENASIGSLSFSPDESQLLCAMKEK